MSIKKLLLLSAAGALAVVSSGAFAGGPDMGPPVEHSMFSPAIYLELNGGYDWYNWQDFANQVTTAFFPGPSSVSWLNKNGGWVGGADVGFDITKFLGVEVGAYYLPELKYLRNVTANS